MNRLLSVTVFLLIAADAAAQTKAPVDFQRDIRPILSDQCFTCHGPLKSTRKAGLRLDNPEGMSEDLGGYRPVVPKKLDESHLWLRLVETDPAKKMPPPKTGKKLTADQIAKFKQWIEEGAEWRPHWSFVAPVRPGLPEVKSRAWGRNPTDRFVLATLEAKGLTPSPESGREALIRRVTFDLTGLPATIAEIEAFVNDSSPEAYEKVVDRLLSSPRYGERMVHEWLDAARYADSNGYQTDGTRAMWPWRDWVIKSLNDNMPFDRFTVEQIAGDMLPTPNVPQKIATGFNRNHMINGEGGRIAEESRVEYVVDRVETTATVWLGFTAGCARCHDHPYNPLSQREFYQLYAYFNSVAEVGGVDRRNSTSAPTIDLPSDVERHRIAELEAKVAAHEKVLKDIATKLEPNVAEFEKNPPEKAPDNVAKILKVDAAKRSADQKKTIREHVLGQSPEYSKTNQLVQATKKELTAANNAVLITMVMEERPQPRDTFILQRGVYNKYGDKVQPGLPAALPSLPKDAANNRLGLARWLVDPANPLTARVTVNRVWQQYFGTGLAKTTEDFGVQGEPPSHPELLDWLAVEFRSHWDLKALHRLIVTSATYRQSSAATKDRLENDPDNRLLSRGPRLRLNSYMLRDQALAMSGLLIERAGGPPTRPYQPPGIWEDFSFNQIRYSQDHGEALYRRSLYTFWRRSIGPPNMFDVSARQVCTVKESRTNTPLHALVMLNDITYVEAARVWAQKLLSQNDLGADDRLALAFRQATARPPRPEELKVLAAAYRRVRDEFAKNRPAAEKLLLTGESPRDPRFDAVEHAALTAVLNMVLNLDEVVTKE